MRAAAAFAAVSLLAAAWYWRRQQPDPLPVSMADGGDAGTWPDLTPPDDSPADAQGFDLAETAAPLLSVVNRVRGTSASSMSTSPAGLAHMQRFEGLRLVRYRLGDGGWTIGWGRYYPDNGPPPPESISRATADEWFAQDVAERGERWVRAYVTADVTQPQFDALVSMAYNLIPRSFRSIAEAVNRGDDPEAAALQFVRAGSNLERGLRNRRAAEVAIFRADPSTYG